MKSKSKKSKIGVNVRKIRNKLGFSQDILSKKTNLSFHTIAKIESGATPDSRIETVQKIADALGVSVDKLLE